MTAFANRQSGQLSTKQILAVYFPLALSWLFMSIEGPIDMFMLGLSSNYKMFSAGFLVLMALAIFIESPVIDLLSTSTTLGSSRQRWIVLSRWTWIMMATVFLIHGVVAFTPVYDLLTKQIMGVDTLVAEATRIPFQIMTPWSALVGWRRYLHGIMIRHGNTIPISVGTLVRIFSLSFTGIILIQLTPINGLNAVAIAMVAAVGAESLFIHIASRKTISNLPDIPEEKISIQSLAKFHLPLTASTMVMLASPVLITRALSRSQDQVLAMAGWQTAASLVWVFRSVSFALPEAVISLYNPENALKLKKFCLSVGLLTTGLIVLFHVTWFDNFWFRQVFQASPETSAIARLALLSSSLLPFLGSTMSYFRGVLTAHHVTTARLVAIAVSIIVLALSLELGLFWGWSGVVVGAFGVTFAQFMENSSLMLLFTHYKRKFPHKFV